MAPFVGTNGLSGHRAPEHQRPVGRAQHRTVPEHVAARPRRSFPGCAARPARPGAAPSRCGPGSARRAARRIQQSRARAILGTPSARARRRRHAPARSAPRSRRSARGRPAAGTRGPCAQSTATSCQKLMSCSAVQIASDQLDVARAGGAEEMQHEQADRVRRAPAVVEHFVERRVALLDDVLAERVEQVVQRLQRQAMHPRSPRRGVPSTGECGAAPASIRASARDSASSLASRSAPEASPSSAKSSAVRANA